MGPEDLAKVLSSIPDAHDERLVTTWASGEDAAMWTIDEERLGILSLDFITPIVDSPRKWGEIAAANSISDIFAMGGNPLIALNIVAFPINCLPLDMLSEILQGGQAKIAEAGGFLVGGHSIEDEEPKYGLCVYGEVNKKRLWKVIGAQPGDALILTKPLGSGIIATAIKADMIEDPEISDEAIHWMSTLNNIPLCMTDYEKELVHACTDVTGFGLSGHVLDMLSPGKLDVILGLENLPLLRGASEMATLGLLPVGAYNNKKHYQTKVKGLDEASPALTDFLFDPQTSGGLLMAVLPENVDKVLSICRNNGFEKTAVIGYFTEGDGNVNLKNHL